MDTIVFICFRQERGQVEQKPICLYPMFLRIKGWFGPLLSDRQIKTVFLVSAILNVLIWLFILVRFWQLIIQNKIIGLHYSIYLGLDDVGSARMVLVVPIIATVVFLVNSILSRLVAVKSRGPALLLASLTLFLEAMCLVAGGYLILINLKS